MAQQLIEMRTPAAYSGVQAYATRHAGTDAGALAYLAIGYARLLDRSFPEAKAALAKAQVRAGELADYVRYFQAEAALGTNEPEKAIAALKDFQKDSQDSIFVRDAAPVYGNALIAADRPQEAVTFLETNRLPQRADIELALGRAYLRAGETAKGLEVLRHLYFTLPLSPEAATAATEMKTQGSALAGSFADRRSRADLLMKGSHWAEAATDYRALLADAPAEERGNLQVLLGVALRHEGNANEGRRLLESAQATGEANAQKLYQLGEIARTADDANAMKANLDLMRKEAPTSPWFEQALISAGNKFLLERDYAHAISVYQESAESFPAGARGSYAHWKAAWLSFRLNRLADAKLGFETQIADYPAGVEVPAAIYWRARIAEQEGETAKARAWYTRCAQRFKNYYYGILSRERLTALGSSASPVAHDAVLDHIPGIAPVGEGARETQPPPDDLRMEKSKLLANAGLIEFAVRELQAADGGKGANWATLQIAQVYSEAGQYHRALQFLKRAVPSYYSMEISELPRQYWNRLFPIPYWGDLRHFSNENGLDPYLVASLIRQESEFNPSAISHANAWGLMQLLPTVGRGEARALHVKRYSTDALLTPAVNIQLGTHYFKAMVNQYKGQVEYALAAYNAGTNRVDDWMAIGGYRDVPEFVESIPFTETREYVQAIVRNAHVYRKLYPERPEDAVRTQAPTAEAEPKSAKGKPKG